MSIRLYDQKTYVLIEADSSASFESVARYVGEHVHEWVDRHVVIDFRQVDFSNVRSQTVSAIKQGLGSKVSIRAGLKTVFVCGDDLAFGMMRMYQFLMEEASGVQISVFRDLASAREWIASPSP